ncbi:beta-ketoacyl synthase chain length factor [Acinetobacter larvae]|uniref:Beta-ketoacyl synthase n=1 Tax=Acinetobacter larvae TaxID=1789224 RepID=A0A1B2M282_9GAMM|nr:beta-ketoacyl synthase chain length factor [Acinetobacter larvae]AOA59297.1 beta-ketoacyl synthase [Acinetobacter larvae]
MISINLSCVRYQVITDNHYEALSSIPAMQRRRLSTLAKLALDSAAQCLAGSSVDYMIWASQYADESKTLKILEDILQDQPASPTAFSTSVHNAIAGLYSILFQDDTPSTSVSASWSEALVDAYAWLKQHPQAKVMLVYYEQALPELYQDAEAFEGFALSAIVSLEHANLSLDLPAVARANHRAYYHDALDFYKFWQNAAIRQDQAWYKCW